MRFLSYGNKQRNKSKPSVRQIKELEKKKKNKVRKVEDETQITGTEESHEISILNAEGNKKGKDSKAVRKIENTGRLFHIVSISAVATLEYSTNRTVKIYSQRQ